MRSILGAKAKVREHKSCKGSTMICCQIEHSRDAFVLSVEAQTGRSGEQSKTRSFPAPLQGREGSMDKRFGMELHVSGK